MENNKITKCRHKIKVEKLKLTPVQLQNARKKALEEFKTLIVWKDIKPSEQ